MCRECGCGKYAPRIKSRATETEVLIKESLFQANDEVATHNREIFRAHGVLALNLMSSPGAGKTSLLEALIPMLSPELRCAVVVGDLETDYDACRIQRTGAPAMQITTGQACHLDATMLAEAIVPLDLDSIELLFIENVGNLVCPAAFDLGEHRRIGLLSVCEGDDKPAKYPTLFRLVDLLLITKADLLPYLPQFSPVHAEACMRTLDNPAPCLTLSSLDAESLRPLAAWVRQEYESFRQDRPRWRKA